MESEYFDEQCFLWALTTRPEDLKTFALKFKADWLTKVEYRPIYIALVDFMKDNGLPPSLDTLHKYFQDKQPEAYKSRLKEILDELAQQEPDLSEQVYTLNQAKDVAVVRSFQEMLRAQPFIAKQNDFNSKALMGDVNRWIQMHTEQGTDLTLPFDDAVNKLYSEISVSAKIGKIPTGIRVIDEWCGGGLREGQLGLIVAPTGHGKSVSLIMAAQKIASVEQLPVWYVSNELDMQETTERFLSRMTKVELGHIMADPTTSIPNWTKHWKGLIKDKLTLSYYARDISTDELEAELVKRSNMLGWKPKVICLDYIERMRPNQSGFSRDKEWNWIGALAKDLIRMAKKHDLLIWTACQTNRSGLSASARGEDLDLSNVQASIKHLQEATAVVAMNQVVYGIADNGDELVGMKWHAMKMRQSRKASKSVTVRCNLSTMEITNDIIAEEEMEEFADEEKKKKLTVRQKQKADQKAKRYSDEP